MDKRTPYFIVICGAFVTNISYATNLENIKCFDRAAAYQQVDASILRSIAIKETSSCRPLVVTNKDQSIDRGCMQINSIHLPVLNSYGITEDDLLDQCKNIFIGAWHYKKQIIRYGNTWQAVGAYFSRTPSMRDAYAREVYKIWVKHFGSNN